jgi:hypothetical protein
VEERFWAKVDRRGPDECWPWLAYLNENGYGIFNGPGTRGGVFKAHRFAYELTIGPIPNDRTIDHECRNRRCCNPSHLRIATAKENAENGFYALKTHCIRGHALTEENLYPTARWRRCKECARIRARGRDAVLPRESRAHVKLSESAVKIIRAEYRTGTVTQKALGLRFGVSRSAILGVLRGENWKDVEDDA